MCKKRSIKNKVLYSCAIIMFMAAILFPIVGSKNVSAQWLYYPANAISLYGTPSITLPYPVPTAPTGLTSLPYLPYNLFYPAGTAPGIPYLPPLVSPTTVTTATAPLTTSPLTSIFSLPSSIYYSPITILSPFTFSIYSSLSPLSTLALAPAASTTSVYNLYYPAGTAPGIPILPPAATAVGTLPYNLYYPPGTAPGIPVLPPLP